MQGKRNLVALTGLLAIIAIGGIFLLGGKNNSNSTTGIRTPSSSQPNGSTTLDYSGRGLTRFPKELLSRTDVTSLNISNNQLSGALPAEIRQMTSLQELNVSNNRMTGIPAEIGQLKHLKVLNYNNNRLTGLPLEFGNLTHLQVLDLSGNNVSQYDLNKIRSKLTSTQIKS